MMKRAVFERIGWNPKVSQECGAMRRWVMKNIGAGSTQVAEPRIRVRIGG
jgi:hypothetical protein